MNDKLQKLQEIQALRDKNLITEEEFSKLRQDILMGKLSLSQLQTDRERLAQKKIWVVVLWALFIPIGAYVYTRRWKAFWITFTCLGLLGGAVGATSEDVEEAIANAFVVGSIVWPLATSIDNGAAISRARNNEPDWTD
ncbi:SHOCT domain-containing protein [Picosynechococcus sp. NKBG15041c]|uniref:SHOCT domain-containing protein n=1 Tax=Picosynechococcus sp. NKBG15041c TaxID=1407650 RepID=UPI00041EB146|nr:SHOCT domain-containing protein [Picosynechococcus sp. NKBG15041c]